MERIKTTQLSEEQNIRIVLLLNKVVSARNYTEAGETKEYQWKISIGSRSSGQGNTEKSS